MAKQDINLGTQPTGVGGDTNRSANIKTNANLKEIYTALGGSANGENGSVLPNSLPIDKGGTGATTAEQAKINLGIAAIPLPVDTNLNDVTTPGTYYCAVNEASATILNVPIAVAFSLKVDVTAGIIQEFTTYAYSGSRRFIRGFYNVWGAWEEVVKGNKRLDANYNDSTGIISPNTKAGIYIHDNGTAFLSRGNAPAAPRWHIDSGGTGGTTAAEARTNLGLGTAATRNIGLGVGDLVTVENSRRAIAKINIADSLPANADMNHIAEGDYLFYSADVYVGNAPPLAYGSFYAFRNLSNSDQLTVLGHDYFSGGIITRGKQNNGWSAWAKHYHTLNTTINGNGYIVPSSPTVKIHPDSFELNEDSIKLGAVCEKLDVGHYEISNVDGFHQEGWYFDIPTDRYNNPLIAADYEYLPDERKIVIKAYAVKANTFPFEPDLDNPMDAPQGRWIDVRLYEPECLSRTELPKPEEPIVDNEGNPAPSRLHELVDGTWTISGENAAILENERLSAMPALTRRQFRLALVLNGYNLADIETLINLIEDPMQRQITMIEWQDATTFHRTNPSIIVMAGLMGLDAETVDQLWLQASTL